MQPTYLRNYHFPLSNFTYTNKAEVNVYVAGGRQEGRRGRGRKQTDGRRAGGTQLLGPSISVIVSTDGGGGGGYGCMDGRCVFFRRLFAKEFLSLPLCLCSPSCILRVPDWLAFLGAQTRSPQFQGHLTARRGSCPNRHWFTKLFKDRGEHLVASAGICIPVRASLFILGPRRTRTRSLHGEKIFGALKWKTVCRCRESQLENRLTI